MIFPTLTVSLLLASAALAAEPPTSSLPIGRAFRRSIPEVRSWVEAAVVWVVFAPPTATW